MDITSIVGKCVNCQVLELSGLLVVRRGYNGGTFVLELKDIWKAISDHDTLQAGQLMRLHLSHLDQQLT